MAAMMVCFLPTVIVRVIMIRFENHIDPGGSEQISLMRPHIGEKAVEVTLSCVVRHVSLVERGRAGIRRKALAIQLPSCALPRSLPMVGMAVLTIVWSSSVRHRLMAQPRLL